MSRRSSLLLILSVLALAAPAGAQSIFTYAGGGSADGKPATAIPLAGPAGISLDAQGNLFIADRKNHRVRELIAGSGVMITVAGNGSPGFSGDGGLATAASIESPEDVAVDRNGNVYIAALGPAGRRAIRRVEAATGLVTTAAQVDTFGSSTSLTIDPLGRLYYSQASGSAFSVARLDPASGMSEVVAGGGTADPLSGEPATAVSLGRTTGLASDDLGNLLIIEDPPGANGRVFRVDAIDGSIAVVAGGGSPASGNGDGGPATAARLADPQRVAIDARGNLYITEKICTGTCAGVIRRVDAATGTIRSIFGAVNRCGRVEKGVPGTEASLCDPVGIAVNERSDVFVSDALRSVVRALDGVTGLVMTVAGSGAEGFRYVGDHGPATAADLALGPLIPGPGFPRQIAVDDLGNLYFAEPGGGRVRRIDRSTGIITTIAGGGPCCTIEDGMPATEADLGFPAGVAVDEQSNVYVSDGNEKVWKVDPSTGLLESFAGGGFPPDGLGDGLSATAASLIFPAGLAVDSAGNLLIADSNHHRIRRVDRTTGTISTVAGNGTIGFDGDGGPATAASLFLPSSLSIDSQGNLFVADRGNNRIRKIDASSNVISTVAGNGSLGGPLGDGGPATAARLLRPTDVTVDPTGDLWIADSEGHRIRSVDLATGIIVTVAGTGTAGLEGDGGAATAATIAYPSAVAVDDDGTLFLADTDNNRIRVIYPCVAVAVAQLQSPQSGSSGLSSAPRLSWIAAAGSLRYDLYLDTADPPVTLAAEDFETTTFAPSNLQPLTTYHWRVVANGDPFCEPFRSSESEVWSFTTTSDCNVPEPADLASASRLGSGP